MQTDSASASTEPRVYDSFEQAYAAVPEGIGDCINCLGPIKQHQTYGTSSGVRWHLRQSTDCQRVPQVQTR